MSGIFNTFYAQNVPNIRPAGAADLLVKIGTDSAYYSLGPPRDVKISEKSLFKSDGLLRNLPWGVRREYVVPTLQASITEIKILDQLLLKTLAGFQIKQNDLLYLKNETANLFGIKWKLTSNGDFDDQRLIEYTIAGNAKPSEAPATLSATGVTVGSPATGDSLATLSQSFVPGDIVPNGLTKVEFKASADADYGDLGDFNKGVWSFECIGPMGSGSRGIPRTHTIKFTCDVHGLQSSTTEHNLIDDILTNQIDLKLTNADGMIITINHTNVSMTADYMNDGNADKERSIDVKFEGSLTPNATGTAYQTMESSPTTWDNLFS